MKIKRKIVKISVEKQLENLIDGIIDNIIRTSDDEILKEIKEDYGDPGFIANKFKKILKKTKEKLNENNK